MKRLPTFFAACCVLAAFATPAFAAEYIVDAPEAGLFGRPTSDDTVYVTIEEPVNIDRSKNAARIPPIFGSATSYLPGSGELLTPNLVQSTNAAIGMYSTNGMSIAPPAFLDNLQSGTALTAGYTTVTDNLYYAGGYLGTLDIPKINLTVKVYQGTDSAALKKGVGHFPSTSIWNGNIAIAGHNRGVNDYFGRIHTLKAGDNITFTTKLGSRTYEVYSVAKIALDDMTILNDSAEDIITLVTCVKDQPSYRWCVQARKW